MGLALSLFGRVEVTKEQINDVSKRCAMLRLKVRKSSIFCKNWSINGYKN